MGASRHLTKGLSEIGEGPVIDYANSGRSA
jgi:hypothetical protein